MHLSLCMFTNSQLIGLQSAYSTEAYNTQMDVYLRVLKLLAGSLFGKVCIR